MSEQCPTCHRALPREFDQIMVDRLVSLGRQGDASREDRWEAIRVMLVDGKLTRRDIAIHMGVDAKTVTRVAKLHGIEGVQPSWDEIADYAAEMVKRYEAGQSLRQIAFAMSKADSTVKKHLLRAGVTMRPSGWKKHYG